MVLATRVEVAILVIMRLAIPAAVGLALAVACVGPENAAPPVQDDPSRFTGRVTRVVDGDTIWLDSRDVSIRIFGLDAPERGRVGGSEATAALTRLVDGKELTCRQRDVDRYGRIVGQCFTAAGRDVTAAMIASGTASEYCRYSGGVYGTC